MAMPVQPSRHADSVGVVIVLAFLGGCFALVGAVADAAFADGAGALVARTWPYVVTALVLWTIAGAAELGAHLAVNRGTLSLWPLLGRAFAAAAIGLAALGAAVGASELAGVSNGFLGLVGVLGAGAWASARPVGRLLHPTSRDS
jgi:hypothetical protein